MNKKRIKTVIICIICILLLLVLYNMKHEKEYGDNPKYKDYVCKDYHLVHLGNGERNGTYQIDIGTNPYIFHYFKIRDISDDKVIAAQMCTNVLFIDRYEGVMQSPDYQIDILNEWTIKGILIYYIDSTEREITMASGFGENLIEEIRGLELNQEPIGGNYYSATHFAEYKESFLKIRPHTYLRVIFEESEDIVWETYVDIAQSAYDKSKYMVTLECGVRNADYEKTYKNVILDPSSELYKFILDAYLEGYPEE